jgi:serine/threonine-protein kinase
LKYCDVCHFTYPNEFTTCPKDQALLRVTSDIAPGSIIRDKYLILEKIGSGGMAAVYRARHLAFNEICALKVVSTKLMDDDAFIRRFKTEAVVTRRLQHPNAVRVDDLDTTEDGRPFIVMECVEGRDLRALIQREGPLQVDRALNIARQVASALTAAHALGITHRDIKPDNILLVTEEDGSETVKVLDFGIAKVREGAMDLGGGYTATKTGMVVGTPQYISPEQAMGKQGDAVDGRADLYSLGVVLYEMLTGHLPFDSDTPVGLLLHHIQTIPTPPHELCPELDIPEALSLLLMKALEKDRTRRFQSADEMSAALDQPQQWATTAFYTPEALAQAPTPTPAAPSRARRMTPARPMTPARAMTPPRVMTPPRMPAAAPAPSYPKFAPPPASSGSGVWITVLIILLAIGIGGGAYLYYRGPGTAAAQPSGTSALPAQPDDAAILAEVKRTLASSDSTRNAAFEAKVEGGVATLMGKTTKQNEADMAGALTAGVAGVRQVKNEIEVEKPAKAGGEGGSAAVTRPKETPARRTPAEEADAGGKKRRARELARQGQAEVDGGDYGAAVGTFQQALELDPNNQAAQEGLRKAQKAKQTEEDIMKRRRN